MRWLVALLGAGALARAQGDGVIRLKPREFPQLPVAVRRDLERRGCTIPQFPGKTAPHNVISGSFIAKGSRDWAVLCSVQRVSRILLYRNGGAGRIDSLARHEDSIYVQPNEQGVREFSRKIDIASAKSIADSSKAHAGSKPPPLDHDGLFDQSVGRSYQAWVYSRAKWVRLARPDE